MLLLLASSAFATDYTLDPTHSVVGFSVTHMMMSEVHGSFGTVTGTMSYDPNDLAATKVQATIGVGSIDTNQTQRDDHLRSPDFFDVAQFPEITFVSTSVRAGKKGAFDLTGDLTIHGVTKPVVLHVSPISAEMKDPFGNTRVGTRAVGTIKRSDFGLTWNKALEAGGWLVGDEVTIELAVELLKQS